MSIPMAHDRHPSRDEGPLPFPRTRLRSSEAAPPSSPGDEALAALESASRNIRDLARELNCLGYFDDADGDRPRAA